MKEINFTEYSKTLATARQIHEELFGASESHEEWANSFNKIGKINAILQETHSDLFKT